MVERSYGMGFGFLPLAEAFRRDLDGYFAIQARVASLVHLAHTTSSQRREDLVGPETGSRGDRHRNFSSTAQEYSLRIGHSKLLVNGCLSCFGHLTRSVHRRTASFKSGSGKSHQIGNENNSEIMAQVPVNAEIAHVDFHFSD